MANLKDLRNVAVGDPPLAEQQNIIVDSLKDLGHPLAGRHGFQAGLSRFFGRFPFVGNQEEQVLVRTTGTFELGVYKVGGIDEIASGTEAGHPIIGASEPNSDSLYVVNNGEEKITSIQSGWCTFARSLPTLAATSTADGEINVGDTCGPLPGSDEIDVGGTGFVCVGIKGAVEPNTLSVVQTNETRQAHVVKTPASGITALDGLALTPTECEIFSVDAALEGTNETIAVVNIEPEDIRGDIYVMAIKINNQFVAVPPSLHPARIRGFTLTAHSKNAEFLTIVNLSVIAGTPIDPLPAQLGVRNVFHWATDENVAVDAEWNKTNDEYDAYQVECQE